MILLITFVITMIMLIYFSYKDIRFRMFTSFIPIFITDAIAIFGSLYTYGVNLITVSSCFCLALPLYIIELCYQYKKDKEGIQDDSFIVGGADILIAPAVTCWFGSTIPVFLIFYLISLLVVRSKKLRKWLDSKCYMPKMVKEGYYPKIPFMTISCMLSAISVVTLVIFC